ncbi:MAG: sigma 54-interacting transcriptional regulator [Desulfobacterales bacterium]|nr:sigma 54-interacting transcriptional regulator [Desulfobacterales bacterium]MBF0398597.1 sigma 54-interacting transcriptional regulator [Desulfobacterales bacterium]
MNIIHSSIIITKLFNSQVLFPSIIDEIPMGILVLNLNREIMLMNSAMEALTGFVQHEVFRVPCAYIVRCNICLEKCPFLSIKEGFSSICLEGDIINKERQKFPVRLTFAPIRNINGKGVGFIECIEDIRAFKALESNTVEPYSFGHIIGRSPQMERLFKILPSIAESDSSVLITGETGTGKDFIAETIHNLSQRAKEPFIKINCGALPETLLESELFGHNKGAFTGAFENKPGRFKLAHNGTIYLTEIGDLPINLQVKLLTFLDDKIIYPLGSTKGLPVNVRIIAATHRNLEQMVRDDKFREDLLFRLNVVRLHLFPLRNREGDTRLLMDHFFNSYTKQFKKTIKGFSDKASKILLNYEYPGNIRELKNIIEYAINICHDNHIEAEHLPAYLTENRIKIDEKKQTPLVIPSPTNNETLEWSSIEHKMIIDALLKARGRKNKAAEILGWGRSTLWRKIKYYGINS